MWFVENQGWMAISRQRACGGLKYYAKTWRNKCKRKSKGFERKRGDRIPKTNKKQY